MKKTPQKKFHEKSHHAMLKSDSKNKFLQKKQEIEKYVARINTGYKNKKNQCNQCNLWTNKGKREQI